MKRTVNENNDFEKGYQMVKGGISSVVDFVYPFIIIVVVIYFILNFSGIGVDDSDKNGWNRSGFKILTDHKTGIEYLYRNGAIIKRGR